MKKILAFSAAVCLAVSAAGCGDKESTSDTDSGKASALPEMEITETAQEETFGEIYESGEETTSEDETSGLDYYERDITEIVKNENGLNYYTSKCGMFTFGISEDLEIDETDDLDIAFKTDDENSIIGMFSFSGFHNTLDGSVDDTIADYKEKYTNVASEESTVNGVPCRSVTAETTKEGVKLNIRFSAFQYGNGDIMYIVYIGAADAQSDMEKYYWQMANSIEYNGEPLKTEYETFSGKYYTATISPMWCFRKKDEKGAINIGLNLQKDVDDIYYGLSLHDPIDGKSPKEAAEDAKEVKNGLKSTVSSEIDETEFLGYDAFRLKSNAKIGELDFFTEHYYFDKDGKCMNINFLYPKDREEEFRNDIQPILDSLEIK